MAGKRRATTALATIRHRWRFALVLLAALLLAVAQPLLSGLFDDESSFDVFFSLLIGTVLLLVFEEREHRKIAISLGLAALFGIWTSRGFGGLAGQVLLIGALLLAVGFFAFALYGILRAIFGRRVSGDAIFGAVCGYLLLGIIWSLLYSAAETASPGSFRLPETKRSPAVAARSGPWHVRVLQLYYLGHGRLRRRDAAHAVGPDIGLDGGRCRSVLSCRPGRRTGRIGSHARSDESNKQRETR